MSVNDISLPTGGLFDFNSTWKAPHQTHRTGKDVDINQINDIPCNLDVSLTQVIKNLSTIHPGLELTCENKSGRPDPNGPFKHIDFD